MVVGFDLILFHMKMWIKVREFHQEVMQLRVLAIL